MGAGEGEAETYSSIQDQLRASAKDAVGCYDAAKNNAGSPSDGLKDAIDKLRNVATLADRLCSLKPEVRISTKTEIRPGYFCAADVVYWVVLVFAMALPWINDHLIASHITLSAASGHWWSSGAIAGAIVADCVLVALLVTIVWRSRSSGDCAWKVTPTKPGALLILFLCVAALVFSFARINEDLKLLDEKYEERQVLEALFTVTAFEHGHFLDKLSPTGQKVVAWEHVSTMLMLIVFFPLLVGRLTSFYGENEVPRKFTATVTADTEVTWLLEVISGGEKKLNTLSGQKSAFEMDGETPSLKPPNPE
jgi:hypothetical protein